MSGVKLSCSDALGEKTRDLFNGTLQDAVVALVNSCIVVFSSSLVVDTAERSHQYVLSKSTIYLSSLAV